jgi:ACS family tartrate transporter-like MFS transporter
MPRSIETANFLTPEEKVAWLDAVALTGSTADGKHSDGGCAALLSAMRCRVVYCAGVWRGFYATALYGVMYFSPLIIREIIGESSADASTVALLTAIPFVLGAASHLLNALHSSRTGERRAHICAPWLLAGVVMALVPVCLSYLKSPAAGFALFVIASVGINSSDGPDVSWVTSLMGAEQRALGLAAVNMFANIGGFVGASAFRTFLKEVVAACSCMCLLR